MECKKCKDIHSRCASGQGFTQFTCKKCGKQFWHHNTDTPNYCEECSEKYNICERCGENLDEK